MDKMHMTKTAACLTAALMLLPGCSTLKESADISAYSRGGASVAFTNLSDPGAQYTGNPGAADAQNLKSYDKMAESGCLALYMEKTTTAVAVVDKRSGKVWYSNPPDADSDPVATDDAKKLLKAQLTIDYLDGQQYKTVDNYTMSIQSGNFSVAPVKNGVAVTYDISDKTKAAADLPQKISNARYQKFFVSNSALEIKDVVTMSKYYTLDKAAGVWALKQDGADVAAIGAVLDNAGYTAADLITDNEENHIRTEASDRLFFKVTLQYVLQDESLIVSVPIGGISYSPSRPPLTITVLKNFGGASADSDGYMFVPDGSGALMEFASKKPVSDVYSADVYGSDKTIALENQPAKTQTVAMPVFGLKDGANAFLAIIEDADALAQIHANRAGLYSASCNIYSSFRVFQNQNVSIGSTEDTKLIALQKKAYGGSMQIRYTFLNGPEADYGGMANYYRNYLIARDGLKKLSPSRTLPLNLELVGAIQKTKSLLGFSYTGTVALTTFGQAQQILKELHDGGVRAVNLKYAGWLSGGLAQGVASDVQMASVLGGMKGLKQLNAYAGELGARLYPSVNFLTAAEDSRGFNPFTESAKQLDQTQAKLYRYDEVTQLQNGYANILAPKLLPSLIDSFQKSYAKTGAKNLSLADLGSQLYADYGKNANVDRQTAENMVKDLLQTKFGAQGSLMIDGAAGYAVKNAEVIVNAPLDDSGFNAADESIPFFAMVFHGLKVYSGRPINESESVDDEVLNDAQFGAVPYYKLIYADGSETKNSDYSNLCSNHYGLWKGDLLAGYRKLSALADLQSHFLVGHRRVQDNVYETTYDDGTRVIVNYNKSPVDIGGIAVGARDFTVVKEAVK